MQPDDVARAVVHAVTTPRGACVNEIDVGPPAPIE
jgi:NADP-dependent 3-hydroxy acid dehydrogenase YdfG